MNLPEGFLLSGINCGIKKSGYDLGLIYAEDFATALGVFTTNANPAYSVTLAKKNINNPIKAVLVNSGNANCYSHESGLKDTEEIITKLAGEFGVKKKNILISSTGIIGKRLPKEKIIKNLPELIKKLDKKYKSFSKSILTTDTFEKVSFKKGSINKKSFTLLGFSKGAGMICPNMATMLGFILTDVSIPKNEFKKMVNEAVEESFNSITIDGCMSTNDTVFVLSSNKVVLDNEKEKKLFFEKLKDISLDLAKMIVKDGEGATKFVEIQIKGAKTKKEAKTAGMALANSNLIKCALYGANTNWGRIISALGQAGINVKENIKIRFTDLKKKNIKIAVDLDRGEFCGKFFTTDLTPEYIDINAEYS